MTECRLLAEGLFGREAELRLISSFLERVAVGGDVLLIVGDAGVGKTALLNVSSDAAVAGGTRVLTADGVEFEADLPFAGLHQVLMPLLGDIEALTELQRDALTSALGLGPGSMPGRLLVSNAALRLLKEAANVSPLLVLVDDLHWLDGSSAEVLSFVARRVSGSRIGFLAAARSETESGFDQGHLPRFQLGPLGHAAASDLLRARFPTLSPRVHADVLAEAKGYPLALLELPSVLCGTRGIDHRGIPQPALLDHRVQAAFASSIRTLPAATGQFLLLAVLEGTGDLGILRLASGDAELKCLVPAEQARVVHVDEDRRRLVFRHPLTRAAIVGLSTRDERRRAHLALAEALAEQPVRRAWHLAEATIGPDDAVAASLEAAGQVALRRGDSVGAVTALVRAAELSVTRADRGRRLARAAYLGRASTDLRDVSRLLAEAERADSESRASLEAAVAAAYQLRNEHGDVDTAHRLLVGALELRAERAHTADAVVAHALHALMALCSIAGRRELWESFEVLIARLGRQIPEALAVGIGLYADPARASAPALRLLDDAVGALRDGDDPMDIVIIGQAAVVFDRLGGCRHALWKAVRNARDGRSDPSPSPLILLAMDDYLTGRWDEAGELTDELLGLYREHGYGHVWVAQYIKALIAAARGNIAAVGGLVDGMAGWALPRGITFVGSCCCHVRASAALAQGDFERAYQQAAAISPAGTFATHSPLALWVAMDLVEAAMRTRRHSEAVAHVAAMCDQGIATLSPRLALLAAASSAIATSDCQEAGELFEAALALPGIDRWPFDLARVRLAYGARLRRARARIEARRQLSAALDTFQSLGAVPWVARADNELRASGVTGLSARHPQPTRLTPQERQIAALVAAGMTNKQIAERLALSPRTVASHLHRIFPKLGIATRSALREALGGEPA